MADLRRALGTEARRASTTARPGRPPRRSGCDRSPGWTSSARPARGCPAARSSGRAVNGAFCGAVATVSELINLESQLAPRRRSDRDCVLVLLLIALLRRRSPAGARSTSTSCAGGGPSASSCAAARQLYGRHWRTMLPIGLTAIPIVGGVQRLADACRRQLTASGDTGPAAGCTSRSPTRSNSFGQPIAGAIVAAVVIAFVRLLVEERDGRASSSPGAACGAASGASSAASCWSTLCPGADRHHRHRDPLRDLQVRRLAVRPAGDPVRGQRDPRGASAAAPHRVRGRWWHTVRGRRLPRLISIAVGPVLGFALIFLNFSPLLDQPDRLARLRAVHPVRGARADAALSGPLRA